MMFLFFICACFLNIFSAGQSGGTSSYNSQALFTYTGRIQSFVVPTDVTEIKVSLYGGSGGDGYYLCSLGGLGGFVNAIVPVTPGMRLFVNVGGAGASSPGDEYTLNQGGWNGGGTGSWGGGAGGGASDIRLASADLDSRLLVAGGGGGGGGGCPTTGGNGGGPIGQRGIADRFPECGGAGGGQLSGGVAVTCYDSTGGNGTLGKGGKGDLETTDGAGGGGYYGGAGGSYYSGGGGGSSFITKTALYNMSVQGVALGNGNVTIAWQSYYSTVPSMGPQQSTSTSSTSTMFQRLGLELNLSAFSIWIACSCVFSICIAFYVDTLRSRITDMFVFAFWRLIPRIALSILFVTTNWFNIISLTEQRFVNEGVIVVWIVFQIIPAVFATLFCLRVASPSIQLYLVPASPKLNFLIWTSVFLIFLDSSNVVYFPWKSSEYSIITGGYPNPWVMQISMALDILVTSVVIVLSVIALIGGATNSYQLYVSIILAVLHATTARLVDFYAFSQYQDMPPLLTDDNSSSFRDSIIDQGSITSSSISLPQTGTPSTVQNAAPNII